MKQKIKVDVVSDVVCPWCYIGKRRLEKALGKLSGQFDFDVQYHPFELNPDLPAGGIDQRAYLTKKFGSEDRYSELTSHVTAVAAEEGLQFDYSSQKVSPNTRKLHALIRFAASSGLQNEMVEILFNAYFTSGIDLSKEENILKAAIEVGLDETMAKEIINDEGASQQIALEEQELSDLGISGVPFFIINKKYGISGAQSSHTFEKALLDIGIQSVLQGETCDSEAKNC